MRLRRLIRLRLSRGTSVVMGELSCLPVLLVLIRPLDLTAPPRATDVLEAEEEEEEDPELPWLAGGSRPCDLRRLLLMAEIPGRILN